MLETFAPISRLRNWTAGQDEGGATVERHLLERVALTHEIGEVRRRHGLAPASRTQFANKRQPSGLVERQRSKGHASHDRVDRRVRPDTQREHDKRRGREGGAPPERSRCVAEILKQ